jgi:hypothetical protein
MPAVENYPMMGYEPRILYVGRLNRRVSEKRKRNPQLNMAVSQEVIDGLEELRKRWNALNITEVARHLLGNAIRDELKRER